MAALDREMDDEGVISEINIIPFVDIVLVLLIIFMVTSTAIVKAALEVELPKAAAAGQAVETTLNIVFTLDRKLMLDGAELTREELAASIRREADRNPTAQAVISADTGVAYGEVVRIIDLVKQNGIETFALNIERDALASAGG
jgi:biopolymer transport protein ExbD